MWELDFGDLVFGIVEIGIHPSQYKLIWVQKTLQCVYQGDFMTNRNCPLLCEYAIKLR